MNARARAHILTVTTTFDVCEGGMCFDFASRTTLMCPSHRNMEWEIVCPYDGEYAVPGRPCGVYMQCGCRPSDEERDALYDEDGLPCPDSSTGLHYHIGNGDVFPGVPLIGCWAAQSSCSDDHVEDFQLNHGDGVWVVAVGYGDSEDCEEGVSFTPLALLEI